MPPLLTSEAVIARTGIAVLPDYTHLIPITDAPGFAVRRSYPPGSDLRHILNNAGQELVQSIIQFVVPRPTTQTGVSRVILRAWVFPRWKDTHLFHGPDELPPNDPLAPTPDSLQRWRLARQPSKVDSAGEFLFDAAEDRFTDTNGHIVTTQTMLEYIYNEHLRTLQAWTVWRWNSRALAQWIAFKSVWRLQDLLLYGLVRLYDIEVAAVEQARMSPFHEYRDADFVRSREAIAHSSSFFGFLSSQKNFVTNLLILIVACAAAYRWAPRGGFLTAIYRNDALTTAALLVGFFLADFVGPKLLIYAICGLSRLRPMVMFFGR
jgi:hypothetical protein